MDENVQYTYSDRCYHAPLTVKAGVPEFVNYKINANFVTNLKYFTYKLFSKFSLFWKIKFLNRKVSETGLMQLPNVYHFVLCIYFWDSLQLT